MLTPSAVANAKPQAKPYKLADERGMYLLVRPNGSRWWRLKYRRPGTHKENSLSLGTYPDVSLRKARQRRDEARTLLADGIDPSGQRKDDAAQAAATFGTIAAEWLEHQRPSMATVTYTKALWLLGMADALKDRPIADLAAPEVLEVLRGIEARGTIETAHRVKQRIGAVLRYAVATGRADRDCTLDLRGALTPVTSTARAAITDPAKIADLLRAIDSYTGQPITRAALRLAPLLFVRPGNLRAMEWAELDLDGAEWRIPAGKMKMRDEHVVPLPEQAVAILRDLQPLTGRGRYCFPSLRTADRPMSENTVNAALRRMGYDKATMTGHGFRALASTRLNEMGWAPDVIERQLAHAERNKVRVVYNRAQYMDERRTMMQAWADYLDALRTAPGKVVPIKRKA
jgi:integrase